MEFILLTGGLLAVSLLVSLLLRLAGWLRARRIDGFPGVAEAGD